MPFLRASASADMAVVEGRYDQATREHCQHSKPTLQATGGGSLDALCQWLDLPRIAVVDVQLLNNCHIPKRPAADALLLDRVGGQGDFCPLADHSGIALGIPVVGGPR